MLHSGRLMLLQLLPSQPMMRRLGLGMIYKAGL
jgi:hypothetical protein